MKQILTFIDWVLDTLPGPAIVYLSAAATALGAAANDIAAAGPVLGSEDVTAWLVRGVAWLGTAVLAIRRVSEVAKEHRGLLPPR